MQNAGYIYAITNTLNGGRYIGSTNAYRQRWSDHKTRLVKGKHHSFILQRAWDKYGASAFVFELLCICPADQRIEYEKRLMPLQRYNVARTPAEHGRRGGWTHTDEFKQQVSLRFKGKALSPEHVEKVRVAQTGKPRSEAFKEKARKRQLGVVLSGVTKERLAAATARARSQETAANREKALSVYAAAKAGGKVGELCAEARITPSTFHSHYRAAGLPPPKRKGKAA